MIVRIRDEKGQALIIVLILLLVGGLIIAPFLAYMTTGLKVAQMHEQKMFGFYAADAGIEDALWKIKYLEEVPTDNYSLTVNDMSVNVLIEECTTLYGEEVGEGNHPNYWIVELESELIDDPSDPDYLGDYTYRLIVTNKHNKNIGINEVKISFSTDLDYLVGYQVDGLYNSTSPLYSPLLKGNFANGSLTVSESGDNQILAWEFPEGDTIIDGNPFADPSDPESWVTVSCIFQLGGFEDALEISNFLLVAVSDDIGTVWERKPFTITARAYDDGTVVTTVTARALRLSAGGTVSITHWEIQ